MNGFLISLLLALAEQPLPVPRVVNPVVHDGDTFVCDIVLGFDVVLRDQHVRVNAFDAWEVSRVRQTVKITDGELQKGLLAKAALVKLFAEAKLIQVIEPAARDPYGRRLLWVYVDGQELGGVMRKAGHERVEPK